jgi:hypothetical protein
MGHRLDQGDMLDFLEESKMRRLPLLVTLKNGDEFEDWVTDIGKFEGEDHVAFAKHDFTPVRRISSIRRALPVAYTYATKH